jgi:hypothetical protein
MNPRALALVVGVLTFPGAVLAQAQSTEDGPFQVRFAVNLNIADSIVNITNSGASSTIPATSFNHDGNICANVYVFLPNEQISSCCSCFVSPNGLISLSVKQDLISNLLVPPSPNSVVIKLLATKAGSTASSCTPVTAALAGTANNVLVSGMVAYGTTLRTVLPATKKDPATYTVTETRFAQPTLSSAELTGITNLCGFIVGNGSGAGVCNCGEAAQQ